MEYSFCSVSKPDILIFIYHSYDYYDFFITSLCVLGGLREPTESTFCQLLQRGLNEVMRIDNPHILMAGRIFLCQYVISSQPCRSVDFVLRVLSTVDNVMTTSRDYMAYSFLRILS